MHFMKRPARFLIPVAAIAAVGLFATGCGGDDDDSSEPSEVAIEVTGSASAPEVTAPAEADAGANEITLTNSADGSFDGQLAFVAEGDEHSDQQVLAELQKAVKGQPVADWFQAAGGPPTTPKGESSTVTQDLEAGTYYVLPSGDSGNYVPDKPTKITVSGDDGADLPDSDGEIDAVEYSFNTDADLKSGEQTLLLDNKGATWHHFLASQLKPDATIEDAKKFLTSQGNSGGPNPFVGEPGGGPISSTVLDAGKSQVVDVDLEPGKYAFFCFLSDKQTGGPPHVVKGMVSEVNVTD